MIGFFFLFLELLESDYIVFTMRKLICFFKIPLFATVCGFCALLLLTYLLSAQCITSVGLWGMGLLDFR